MIDWHSHILPGLDDGAETLEESLALGRLLEQAGFSTVHCTPHCLKGMYDNRPADVRSACAGLQAEFDREGIKLRLRPGMEYCLDEFFPDYIDDLLPLGESRYVLAETPSRATTQQLKENIFLIRRAGFEPLFAHPERHAFLAPPGQNANAGVLGMVRRLLQDEPVEGIEGTPLAELIAMGCRLQCNLGSVGGFYGSLVQKQVRRFMALGLYFCIGSDTHNVRGTAPFLNQALQEVRDHAADLIAL